MNERRLGRFVRIWAARDTYANIFLGYSAPQKGAGGPWLNTCELGVKFLEDRNGGGLASQLCCGLKKDEMAEVVRFSFDRGLISELRYGTKLRRGELVVDSETAASGEMQEDAQWFLGHEIQEAGDIGLTGVVQISVSMEDGRVTGWSCKRIEE